jgi:hypothetical protein
MQNVHYSYSILIKTGMRRHILIKFPTIIFYDFFFFIAVLMLRTFVPGFLINDRLIQKFEGANPERIIIS